MSRTVDATQRDAGGGTTRKSMADVDSRADAGGVGEKADADMKASVSADLSR